MNVLIYPYKKSSKSAKVLTEALRGMPGIGKCARINSTSRCVNDDTILINWGCSNPAKIIYSSNHGFPVTHIYPDREVDFNKPINVDIAADKISTLRALKLASVTIPKFWTTDNDSYPREEVFLPGKQVVCRRYVRSTSGKGIDMFNVPEDVPYPVPGAKLFTQYIKKTSEYRVHVFRSKVIDVQEKRIRTDFEGDVNHQVRNYNNGWVFCRENVNPEPKVLEQSVRAVLALGLDFGAVDVIWNQYYEDAFVLEVNTAPGLEGSTINSYAQAFAEAIKNA